MTVFDRNDYVNDALQSLYNQSLGKKFYEVIVVSNIALELPTYLGLNIIVVKSDAINLSGKICQGVDIAKGKIIAFLEDDDIYSENRLYSIFLSYLKYKFEFYHNDIRVFSDLNFIFLNKSSKIIEPEEIYEYPNRKTIGILYRSKASYNLSSIVITKHCLKLNYFSIMKLNTLGLDNLFFFIWIKQGGRFVLSKSKLTFVRTHNRNTDSNYRSRGNDAVNEIMLLIEISNSLAFTHFKKTIAILNQFALFNVKIKYNVGSRFNNVFNMTQTLILATYARLITVPNFLKQIVRVLLYLINVRLLDLARHLSSSD